MLGPLTERMGRLARRLVVTTPARAFVDRALFRAARDQGLVLMYHRVLDGPKLPLDPHAILVHVNRFAAQMEHLARFYDVVPLQEIGTAEAVRRRRPRAAITFDDGYEDNYRVAFPILRRLAFPATVFVTTDLVGSRTGIWWDRLQRAICTLPVGQYSLSPTKTVTLATDLAADRLTVVKTLVASLAALPATERAQIMARIEALMPAADGEPLPHGLTRAQIAEMRRAGVTFGAHSVSHASLGRVPVAEAGREIRGSKRHLEEVLGEPITMFAYPFGGPEDLDDAVVRMVRGAGFERACTTEEGTNDAATDRFRLRRLAVRDWDAIDFDYQLLVLRMRAARACGRRPAVSRIVERSGETASTSR